MLNLIETNGLICLCFLLLSGHSGPYHDRLEQLEAHLDQLRVTNPIASRHTRRKFGPYICRFFPSLFYAVILGPWGGHEAIIFANVFLSGHFSELVST